jgi:hypothetical protein
LAGFVVSDVDGENFNDKDGGCSGCCGITSGAVDCVTVCDDGLVEGVATAGGDGGDIDAVSKEGDVCDSIVVDKSCKDGGFNGWADKLEDGLGGSGSMMEFSLGGDDVDVGEVGLDVVGGVSATAAVVTVSNCTHSGCSCFFPSLLLRVTASILFSRLRIVVVSVMGDFREDDPGEEAISSSSVVWLMWSVLMVDVTETVSLTLLERPLLLDL